MITLKKQHKRYSNYKDSGVEWIGEIPSDWEVKKFKYYGRIVAGQSPDNNDVNDIGEGLPFFQGKAEFGKINPVAKNYCTSPKKIAKNGDILISVRAPVGDLNFANEDCCIGRGLAAISSKNQKYLYYVFLFSNQRLNSKNTGSTFDAITGQDIKNLEIVLPQQNEIIEIESYLDKKTALLDSIIEKKKQQIELLKEKRTALINKAVTRGLDDNVEMKNSGVEWIGEIPKGWKVEKLKFASIINKRSLGENTQPDYLIRYVDIGNVTIEGIKSEPEEMLFENAPSRARRMVKAGNTILGTVRTYLKAIAYLEKPESNLIVSTGFAVIESKQNKLEDKYLYYLILSEQFVNRVVAYSKGVSYPAINSTELGNLPVFIPPKDEQKKIIDYLDRENQRIGYAIGKIEESISFLQEYKTSLISNVITGKINVMTI